MPDTTIAIRDDGGTLRRITKIIQMRDGIAVCVPYHTAREGWLFKSFPDYSRTDSFIPASELIHYTASQRVKLSIHLGGFVQFSGSEGQPIVSGYDREKEEIKGLGVRAPDPIVVDSGPLFGLLARRIEDFEELGEKKALIFEKEDLWFHPRVDLKNAKAHHLEGFMFPLSRLSEVRMIGGKPILRTEMPFVSLVRFRFDLRVVELPGLDMFLGLAVHPMDADEASGFSLSGPGCGPPGKPKAMITAWYPRPHFITEGTSLDYQCESQRKC